MDVSTSWLDSQHRELDHRLAEVEFLAERRAFDSAAKRFREFRELFLEHMRKEEEDERLAAVLKPAHLKLEMTLDAVMSALEQGDYTDFCYGINVLSHLVAVHERTEEDLAR